MAFDPENLAARLARLTEKVEAMRTEPEAPEPPLGSGPGNPWKRPPPPPDSRGLDSVKRPRVVAGKEHRLPPSGGRHDEAAAKRQRKGAAGRGVYMPPPRVQPPPRQPQHVRSPGKGGPLQTTVLVLGVPVEYALPTLTELHEAVGLAPGTMAAVRFLRPNPAGEGPASRAVVLRYKTEEAAKAAAQALDEQPVVSEEGETTHLSTRLLDPGVETVSSKDLQKYKEKPQQEEEPKDQQQAEEEAQDEQQEEEREPGNWVGLLTEDRAGSSQDGGEFREEEGGPEDQGPEDREGEEAVDEEAVEEEAVEEEAGEHELGEAADGEEMVQEADEGEEVVVEETEEDLAEGGLEAQAAALGALGAVVDGEEMDEVSAALLEDALKQFVEDNGVDAGARKALWDMTNAEQQVILDEGPCTGANPSAVLMSRIRRLAIERGAHGPPLTPDQLEKFLADNDVDSTAAGTLREAPAEIQKRVVVEGPVTGRNPSAIVASRIRRAQNELRQLANLPPPPAPPPGTVKVVPPRFPVARQEPLAGGATGPPPPPVGPPPPGTEAYERKKMENAGPRVPPPPVGPPPPGSEAYERKKMENAGPRAPPPPMGPPPPGSEAFKMMGQPPPPAPQALRRVTLPAPPAGAPRPHVVVPLPRAQGRPVAPRPAAARGRGQAAAPAAAKAEGGNALQPLLMALGAQTLLNALGPNGTAPGAAPSSAPPAPPPAAPVARPFFTPQGRPPAPPPGLPPRPPKGPSPQLLRPKGGQAPPRPAPSRGRQPLLQGQPPRR